MRATMIGLLLALAALALAGIDWPTVTGLPALNVIASVVKAPPGLLTSADVPLRGFAGRFAL